MEGERKLMEALSELTDTRPSFEPSSFRTRLWIPDPLTVISSGYEEGDNDNYVLLDSFVAGFQIVVSSCPYFSES